MEVLRRHRRQSFEDSVVARIAVDRLQEAAVRKWVRSAIPEALTLGFRAEPELLRLLVAQYAMRDAPAYEEVSRMVADTDLTPATRLSLIEATRAPR